MYVSTASPARLDILGVPVDTLASGEVDRWLEAALAEPWDGRCRHLVTLNPEYAMATRWPGATIAGDWDGGSPHAEDDAAALARIRASGANVVLVAYGASGQV